MATGTAPRTARVAGLAAVLAGALLTACGAEGSLPGATSPAAPSEQISGARNGSPDAPAPSGTTGQAESKPRLSSDGRPARARLTIARLGLTGLLVVPYRGRTDDAPGTAIQNRGHAASPFGPRGGVGPGGVGNYQVTGHRLSSTMPFRHLGRLQRGDRVLVAAHGVRYVYRIVATRQTSFRSERSLRAQRAGVPGRPGVQPTRAMITLSTCATLEDHAAGNYWADEFDNPEHRIDKIGVLERIVPGPAPRS